MLWGLMNIVRINRHEWINTCTTEFMNDSSVTNFGREIAAQRLHFLHSSVLEITFPGEKETG